jgi:hypothetical protein
MILYVISDYDGYYQVPQVMTKDYNQNFFSIISSAMTSIAL